MVECIGIGRLEEGVGFVGFRFVGSVKDTERLVFVIGVGGKA